MELANALVALNGDRGNTVPVMRATPAQIAVLCAIHGQDAVFDIQPLDEEIDRSNRDELNRLARKYTGQNEDGTPIVRVVYPGASPILHRTLEDLGLPEDQFKATERMSAKKKAKPKTKSTARAKADADEKPRPVTETSAPANSADALFEDDEGPIK